jgi:hypothetical protein
MTLAIINNWHTKQFDFVQAFPQADIEKELYMKLPEGCEDVAGFPHSLARSMGSYSKSIGLKIVYSLLDLVTYLLSY